MPELLPLTGRIEESFQRRLQALPDDTRRLLLIAAAEPVGDPALMWRTASGMKIPSTPSATHTVPHVTSNARSSFWLMATSSCHEREGDCGNENRII